jgi:hypothetical protein
MGFFTTLVHQPMVEKDASGYKRTSSPVPLKIPEATHLNIANP